MLIKLTNQAIADPESNKLLMIMETDASATLRFMKKLTVKQTDYNIDRAYKEYEPDPEEKLEFRDLDQLTLQMKMGPMETITHHVQHRFNTAKAEFEQNQKILNDIVRALQIKNPSLISQILKQVKVAEHQDRHVTEIDWDGNEDREE